MALLRSYVGAWHGEGALIGSSSRPLLCTLTLKQASIEKINYSGKCSVSGGVLSVRGTLAYIDAAKRYEAIMTTSLTFTGVAIGQKRGTGVVFELRENDQDHGRDLTISARIALQRDSIKVEFELFYEETGEFLKASIPFTR